MLVVTYYPPQSRALGEALGTALGSFLKSRTQNAGTSTTDQTQSAQVGSTNAVPVSAPDTDTTENMSDADKQLMAKGMWHDPKTGLIWMRCSLGQSWNGSNCDGRPLHYNWQLAVVKSSELQFGGFKDWRLPTQEELESIVIKGKLPATNAKIFLGIGGYAYDYRTTTLYQNPYSKNWTGVVVSFYSGDTQLSNFGLGSNDEILGAIAVRSGHPSGEFEKNLVIARKAEVSDQGAQKSNTARVAAFRNSVKVGDVTTLGPVLEVRGNLIGVEFSPTPPCIETFENGSCAHYASRLNTPKIVKWIQRSEISPR